MRAWQHLQYDYIVICNSFFPPLEAPVLEWAHLLDCLHPGLSLHDSYWVVTATVEMSRGSNFHRKKLYIAMNMHVLVEPIQQTTVPMLSFPIEYVHGPVSLNGTMGGLPVHGIGSFERTQALYRDFELAIVLSDSLKHLPPEATSPVGAGVDSILAATSQVSALIDARDFAAAKALADGTLKTQLEALTEPSRTQMLQIRDDMSAVIGVYGSMPGVAP